MDHTPRLRASDDDRSQTVSSLQEALSRGQLTLGEFDERAKLAYGARFRDELEALLADLTPDSPAPPARPSASCREATVCDRSSSEARRRGVWSMTQA